MQSFVQLSVEEYKELSINRDFNVAADNLVSEMRENGTACLYFKDIYNHKPIEFFAVTGDEAVKKMYKEHKDEVEYLKERISFLENIDNYAEVIELKKENTILKYKLEHGGKTTSSDNKEDDVHSKKSTLKCSDYLLTFVFFATIAAIFWVIIC